MDNSWSSKKEVQLNYWKNVCNEYSNIHDTILHKYEKTNKIFIISKLSLSAMISILSGINTYYGLQILSIIILILSGLSVGILTYTQYVEPETKIMLHNICSKRYKQLYLKIDKELAQEYSERINGSEFIKIISSELQDFMNLNFNNIQVNIIRQKSLHSLNLEEKGIPNNVAITSQFELFFTKLPGIDIELDFNKDRFNNI